MKQRRSLASLLFAFALIGSACGADATIETREVVVGDDGSVEIGDAEAGSDGDAGGAQLVEGADFDLEAYAGQDLLVWFWAPW